MSKLIKGFIGDNHKVINTPNIVNKLGEITPYSLTFGKEIGSYSHDDYNNLKLYTLYTRAEDNDIELDFVTVNEIFTVYKEINKYCENTIKPIYKDLLLNEIKNTFKGVIDNIRLGNIVEYKEWSLPGWFSYTSLAYDYECKIWLSGSTLDYDYDEYSIVVVPPVSNLDVFFTSVSEIEDALSDRPISRLIDIAQELKEKDPETVTRVHEYNYVNKTLDLKISTNWCVLIYGPSGDDVESIKEAIRKYVLDNSTHTETEWKEIFPDIFSINEFILIPRFDQYAIPSLYVEKGIYSSIFNLQDCINYCTSKIDYYPKDHIVNNVEIFPYDYNAIMICCIPGDSNDEACNTLNKVFKDFIPVSSTGYDFNRMKEGTKEWCLKLELMLKTAENLDEYSEIPNGLKKVFRNDKLYVSFTYNKIKYLMLSSKF